MRRRNHRDPAPGPTAPWPTVPLTHGRVQIPSPACGRNQIKEEPRKTRKTRNREYAKGSLEVAPDYRGYSVDRFEQRDRFRLVFFASFASFVVFPPSPH